MSTFHRHGINKTTNRKGKTMREQLKKMAVEADAKSEKAVARMERARKRGHVLAFHNAKIDFRNAIAVVAAVHALMDVL